MSYQDFETRKSIHVNLISETHAAIKITAFKNKLSMQEIFEELAQRIVEKEPYMVRMLGELAVRKRKKAVKQLSSTDAESIFRVIEEDNPLADDKMS